MISIILYTTTILQKSMQSLIEKNYHLGKLIKLK